MLQFSTNKYIKTIIKSLKRISVKKAGRHYVNFDSKIHATGRFIIIKLKCLLTHEKQFILSHLVNFYISQ